jgi:predicted ATPase
MQTKKICRLFLIISYPFLFSCAHAATKYIVTGPPGAGKTTLLLGLEIHYGFDIIREAAADIISFELSQNITTPWNDPQFDAKILNLQIKRFTQTNTTNKFILCDRSPIDVYAYAEFHNMPLPDGIDLHVTNIVQDSSISKTVFFVESLNSIQNTAIRRETLEEAKKIKLLLHKYYTLFGFTLICIPSLPLNDRIEYLLDILNK